MTDQPSSDVAAPSDLVLVMSPDNHMIHVSTPRDIVDHFNLTDLTAGQTLPDDDGALEFYSSTAGQLSVNDVVAMARGVAPNERSGKRPADDDESQQLLARIDDSLRFVQDYLNENPVTVEGGVNGPSITISSVPDISGTYPEVLEQLARLFGFLEWPGPHRTRNPFHNLWHIATGTS